MIFMTHYQIHIDDVHALYHFLKMEEKIHFKKGTKWSVQFPYTLSVY